jgi:hypothetical protein
MSRHESQVLSTKSDENLSHGFREVHQDLFREFREFRGTRMQRTSLNRVATLADLTTSIPMVKVFDCCFNTSDGDRSITAGCLADARQETAGLELKEHLIRRL